MTHQTFRPRRSLFRRWLRKVWWVQPPFTYPVRWWHHLDRAFIYLIVIILAVSLLFQQYIAFSNCFCL